MKGHRALPTFMVASILTLLALSALTSPAHALAVEALDFREVAPAAATQEMYLDGPGEPRATPSSAVQAPKLPDTWTCDKP